MAFGLIRGQNRIENFLPTPNTLPEIVWHYTSHTGLVSILENGEIRFYDYHYMNDISELEHIYELAQSVLPSFPMLQMHLQRYADKTQQSGPIPKSPETLGRFFSESARNYYLFCTCTNYDSLSMWNYYIKGSKREGANIGFSIDDLRTALSRNFHNAYGIETIISGPVVYEEEAQKAQLSDMFDKAQQELSIQKLPEEQDNIIGWLIKAINTRRVFFKHPAFKDENEYRYVIIENDALKQTDDLMRTIKDAPQIANVQKFYEYKNGFYTSYYEANLAGVGVDKCAIKYITLAPSSKEDYELQKCGLSKLLAHNGRYPSVVIQHSRIPVRY